VAGFHDAEPRQIDMALHCLVDLARAQRGDALLELDVPGERAAEEQVHVQPPGERAVLRARDAARFQEPLLRRLDLLRAEAPGERARDFLAQRGLDAALVRWREYRRHAEQAGLVLRVRT